jgi:hypothetical protein
MLTQLLLTGALLVLAPVQDTDTTFAVDPNERLSVSNFSGEIIIRTWSRNEVRIRADHSRRDGIVVDRSSGAILVRAQSWRRWAHDFDVDVHDDDVHVEYVTPRNPSIVDYEVTVPASMALELGGPFTDVTVHGAEGQVMIKVGEGDVDVIGGRGRVTVRAVEGDVTLNDAGGEIQVISMDGDVIVENSSGNISVETTDGDIKLGNVQSSNVQAVSVDGDIWFGGTLAPQGLYTFNTHDGDVTVLIPRNSSVRVRVASYDGEFSGDFEITLPERIRGRRFSFTLGEGSAEMEIDAFDGDIELLHLERGTDFEDSERNH